MSSRSLPAGQHIPPPQGTPNVPVVGGYPPAGDMAGVPPAGNPAHANAHAHGHGNRRRPHGPPHPQYMHPYYQPPHPMYSGYMPYPSQYYGVPPQYPNGAMHPAYVSYQNYARVPSATYQNRYPSNHPKSIEQHSPGPAMPMYQPPPASAPVPSQTPSSTHSSLPPPPTPPTPQTAEPYNESSIQQALAPGQQAQTSSVVPKLPFRPPLPWLSHPNEAFPSRSSKQKTRRKPLHAESEAVSLPVEQHEAATEQNEISNMAVAAAAKEEEEAAAARLPVKEHENTPKDESSNQAVAAAVKDEQEAIAKPEPKSLVTPENSGQQQQDAHDTASKSGSSRSTAQPAVPPVAAIPKTSAKQQTPETKAGAQEEPASSAQRSQPGDEEKATSATESKPDVESAAPQPAPKPAPTSWANLFAKTRPANNAANVGGATASTNGDGADPNAPFPKISTNSVAEAIRAYEVSLAERAFIEPRGLINTGNMCYMNSVLMFCAPFYSFLDQVGKKAAHSFKSETPLIDSMILFMQEFKVLKSAGSVDQLRNVLKAEDLEKFGEPFTPEFVYEAIRRLARFESMRPGHQQDAEEFLGFLLQSLDDECTHVMGNTERPEQQDTADDSAKDGQDKKKEEWQEVGRKQKAAVTRSSGPKTSTPITKMFGGLLRSELRVPGLKDSITTEPYQPLQLDIGSSDIRNVTEALRGITRSEYVEGDFNPARAKGIPGTKQVFIDSLPPVLILHLKRFQFNDGESTKIWKKIDYPLELEIPSEALSRSLRARLGRGQMPKYKLISVVYHHGKNASGGHYTVDVRRQDDDNWLRLDDTLLRRVASGDVAEVGAEEERKESRKENAPVGASGNRYGPMNEKGAGDDEGWSQVLTSAGGNKRSSNAVNGSSNGTPKGKQTKESVKDNKVAYLLFYQRI